MTASSYTLLYPDAPGYVRVACCEDFGQVMAAKQDGCDAALIHNDDTRRWYEAMKAKIAGSKASLDFIPIELAAMLGIKKNFRGGVNRANLRSEAGFHIDMPFFPDYQGLMTTVPTTVICAREAVLEGDRDYFFETENGRVPIRHATIEDSPQFSPLPGSFLIMFNKGGRFTLAHSIPFPVENSEGRTQMPNQRLAIKCP